MEKEGSRSGSWEKGSRFGTLRLSGEGGEQDPALETHGSDVRRKRTRRLGGCREEEEKEKSIQI